jgi:hypothetical protein
MKVSEITRVPGRIVAAGVLQVRSKTLGMFDPELMARIHREIPGRGKYAERRAKYDAVIAERQAGYNVVALRCGVGAKAAGFSTNQWVFVIAGRAYARVPGPSNKGQCFLRGNRWHTRVVPLRGRRRRAVLDAWGELQAEVLRGKCEDLGLKSA